MAYADKDVQSLWLPVPGWENMQSNSFSAEATRLHHVNYPVLAFLLMEAFFKISETNLIHFLNDVFGWTENSDGVLRIFFFSCTVSAFGFLSSNFHLSIHALLQITKTLLRLERVQFSLPLLLGVFVVTEWGCLPILHHFAILPVEPCTFMGWKELIMLLTFLKCQHVTDILLWFHVS